MEKQVKIIVNQRNNHVFSISISAIIVINIKRVLLFSMRKQEKTVVNQRN